MVHKLKLREEFVMPILSGDKLFEIRKNDRGYQKGDIIKFEIVDNNGKSPKLMSVAMQDLESRYFEITYLISSWGIKAGYVCFGIRDVTRWKDISNWR